MDGALADLMGRRTVFAYDAVRNLIAVTDPAGGTVRYGHDPDGRVTQLTDGRGNLTRFERDIQGRLVGRVYADGSREGYGYDAAAGRLSARTRWSSARTTAMPATTGWREWIMRGRWKRRRRFGSRTTRAIRAGCASTAPGRRATSITRPAARGGLQLAEEAGPSEVDTIGYGYDALGRLGSRQVGAAEERWSYDALGRIGEHRNPLGVVGYTYLSDSGQVTGELLEGCRWRNGGIWTMPATAGWRGWPIPAARGSAHCAAMPIASWGLPRGDWVRLYRYDAKDRLVLAAVVSRAQALGRLDRVRATRGVLYRYDAADNLLQGRTLPSQINARNQLRRWAGKGLAYDANGNLIADGRWRYRYDAENRLVGMQA